MTEAGDVLPPGGKQRDLIEATLECIAELGIQGTSVRAVAARAGVSNGLIRHHFDAKANLILAAYRRTIELISTNSTRELKSTEGTPRARLRRFIVATLDTPASDPRLLSLWATFISQSRVDPEIAAVREKSYLALRRATEPLIAAVFAAEGRPLSAEEVETTTVVVHAMLDGLWIEAGLSQSPDGVEKLIALGIHSVEKLLDIKL
ncbi:TetR family transcriptional regulator C-terminal domain-containing protein [Shinella curvata]|uniref:TetR family transcriptional regulator C-terminal domain-containing protein n=1 Tax=Shinella curvata TaxID=1817964 RepID=A0ABT8XAL9_9HYPH|nr:TetR family transcriptional regulator C-terminal domain-containing protein [Shinella curvata]MCJ8054817.1 TetR family transcriptional regulator C-terminal domain-containing protein [Shinella curvata]MDO6120787.1 TetR family transcriptional regulator C-terminal domain-containing protein [Shinella curvata]